MHLKLREIRNREGISAKEMVNLLGVKTEAAYYKKESGLIKFSLEEAKLIANKFNMQIEGIFFENSVSIKATNMQKPTWRGV